MFSTSQPAKIPLVAAVCAAALIVDVGEALSASDVKEGRVISIQAASGGRTKVTINRGSSLGLRRGSRIYFLRGDSRRHLRRNGRRVSFRCKRVEPFSCSGYVRLSVDTISAHRRVLTPARRGRSGAGSCAPRGIRGRVIKVQMTSGGKSRVIINRGADHRVRRGWKVHFLRGSSDRRLGVAFRCDKVTTRECRGTAPLSIDTVSANRQVVITRR